jgi:hypothetical protein
MLLSYSSVLLVDTGKILLSVRIHDLNESHIHPSTCSSTLRTSFKSGRFLTIFFWLSYVSKKLCNSWHIVYISIQNPISLFRSILTKCYFSQFSFFEFLNMEYSIFKKGKFDFEIYFITRITQVLFHFLFWILLSDQ